MAHKSVASPFLRLASNRSIMLSLCPRPVGDLAEINSSVLENKVVVASANGALPITRVAVAFRAGSRHEDYESLGASHMLRIMAGQSTRNSTGFAITRNMQQIGGGITVTGDREIVSYSMETTALHIDTGLRFLQDCLQPAFKPWEISDSTPLVKTQIAAIPPQVQAIELAHQAAFRTGLGNSIYIPKFRIGQLKSPTLLEYVTCHFTASRCAVVGVGIDNSTLVGFAQSLDLYDADSKQEKANYYGGDVRKDKPGQWAHVAICGQGGAVLNQKEALAFAILEHALGAYPATKRGQIHGSFGNALCSLKKFSFTTLNACYAETGLFGFVLSTDTDHICEAVGGLVEALKSGTVCTEDFNRGKALLLRAVHETYTTDHALLNEMASQALLTKQVLSGKALIAAIECITQKDVQAAAQKAGSSKLSIGAVGNLENVPYASDFA